ncbi:hypothetical protein ACFQ6N_09345 [Kitasatospora sp. NPDC056446]|uniref:hypothetical protein n=1 Tax=Kitasatospora sp. NPDC056446 TaxID=3345819 RepID=UPI00369E4AFE
MANTSDDHGGISITGNVTGIVQSGSRARAEFTHRQTVPEQGEAPEPRALLAAVDALRAGLRALPPGELPSAAAEAAGQALDEVAEASAGTGTGPAVAGVGDSGGDRIRRAVYTLTGALGAATTLAEALQALTAAAAPWF